MALSTNNQGTDFDIKKSYAAYPSSGVTDGTVYVRQGSVTSGSSTVDGPEYSARLGSGTGLQLDKDKIYTVEGCTGTTSSIPDFPQNLYGTVPGLTGYFQGLKVAFDFGNTVSKNARSVNFYLLGPDGNPLSTGDPQVTVTTIYSAIGKELTSDMGHLRSLGMGLMEYREDIPTDEPNVYNSGFVVLGNPYDAEITLNGVFLKRSGGTMNGNINMYQNFIKNLPAPEADGDAANKKYVDDQVNELQSQITALTSVADPDVRASEIDGTIGATVAYMGYKDKVSYGNVLGFSQYMIPNTTIHIFVYCEGDIAVDSGIGKISSGGALTIPYHLCGGKANPGYNDWTFVNGQPTYLNQTSISGTNYKGSDTTFNIPANGFLEISIFYNEYEKTIGGSTIQFSRTIIKVDQAPN